MYSIKWGERNEFLKICNNPKCTEAKAYRVENDETHLLLKTKQRP
jgi:hypothetical protein